MPNGVRNVRTVLRVASALALLPMMLLPGIAASEAPTRSEPARAEQHPPHKQRLFVLTDIGGDPDDKMSMVRLLTYANHFDIEGLAATRNRDGVFPAQIASAVAAYAKVRDNLEKHEAGFPDAALLRSKIVAGPPVDGRESIGARANNAASDALIAAADRADKRPLWVAVWGGPSVLAQALWKVRKTHSKAELDRFVSTLRVYAISDQDDSGPWIRTEFPGLFYVVNPGNTFHHSTWIGIGGDYFHGRFVGADWSLVTNEWLQANVRAKGPLGAEYPRWKFMMEGDTPSFLNLIDNGLSVPERPDWGGWGGRFELYTPRRQKWFLAAETRPIWTDAQDEVLGHDGRWHSSIQATIWRWRQAYQNDFAARMDWTIKAYADANHPPRPRLATPAYIQARAGDRIELSAAGSSDPDGDALSYDWFVYEEAGTRSMSSSNTGLKHEIANFDQAKASLVVKRDRVVPPGLGTIHVILAVTDHGKPRLTRYRRTIIDVIP